MFTMFVVFGVLERLGNQSDMWEQIPLPHHHDVCYNKIPTPQSTMYLYLHHSQTTAQPIPTPQDPP